MVFGFNNMKELAEILINTPVSALINAKPMKKKNFICLEERDTVRTALVTFITHDIESIPIKTSKQSTIDNANSSPLNHRSDDFAGIVSLVNLLKFIFSTDSNIQIPEILDYQLIHANKLANIIQETEFVRPETSLIHLLLNVWGSACNPKANNNTDRTHLLTSTQSGKYEVITPLDFLRHLLFINEKAIKCLRTSSAAEIENGIDVDENSMVFWGEDLHVAVSRIIHGDPSFLIAIVNEETGTLEASVTFYDLLPKNVSLLEESISLIRRQGISIHSYLHTLYTTISPKSTIDPILLYSHFSIYDLIEKLTRLKVHHLWRVTPDSKKKPIGAVGVNDILRYLCFMFRPFLQDKSPDGQVKVQINKF